jgi:hypothetical protein
MRKEVVIISCQPVTKDGVGRQLLTFMENRTDVGLDEVCMFLLATGLKRATPRLKVPCRKAIRKVNKRSRALKFYSTL